jgi:alcohol dehydrogenase (cytochrome c)
MDISMASIARTTALLYRVPVTRVEDVAESFSPGDHVHFCPGAVGGAEWNSPAYDPRTNLIFIGEVEWCETVTIQSLEQLRAVPIGQPWVGMATWNPFWMFGRQSREWAGWLYAVDADTGVWKWRLKSNYPIVGAMTPTAGGVVFFGDLGGNFYALDAATGEKLWGREASGFTMLAWPTKIVKAKIEILGLDSASANQ